jgi:hypothetical protein
VTERSTLDILLAQLECEVSQSKRALMRQLSDLGASGGFECSGAADALETLIDKCVKRWWLTRMVQKPGKPIDPVEMVARMNQRGNMLAECTRKIVAQSGPITPEALQIVAFGLSAQLDAIWALLIESALATQSSRQDYMDAATQELHSRVVSYAQKIVLAGANGSGITPS